MKKKRAAAEKSAGLEATRPNGTRRGEVGPIGFIIERSKRLAQLTADDIPPGIDPYDVASDYAPSR